MSLSNLRAVLPHVRWVVLGACSIVGLGAIAQRLASPGAGAPPASTSAPIAAAPARETGFRPTPQQLSQLTIQPAQIRTFRTEVVAEGRIAANGDRATPVFSPYSGRIVRLLASPGDSVRAGQPLFAVQATEFVQAQNDLATALAARNTSKSALRQAQLSEQRKHALYDAQGGSLQDWQQSQAELAAAQDAARAAEISVSAVKGRLRILGKSDAQIAQIAQSGHVDPTAIVAAPIGGTVIERPVALGQYIQAGASDPQARVADLSTVWLLANVRESDAPLVRLGAPVDVSVLALPGRTFEAKVNYVGSSIDRTTRRITVRASIPNAQRLLKPEMYATFAIGGADAGQAVAVPEQAVIYEGEQARVWVLQPGGTLVLRSLRPGRTQAGWVEAIAGLAAGDKVVTAGSLFIDRAARRE